MKKKSLLTRALAGALAALLLLPSLPLSLLAEAVGAAETLTPDAVPSELDGAVGYLDVDASLCVSDKTNSPYPNAENPQTMLGLPVDLHFYYDKDHAEYQGARSGVTEGDPVILYVMGTQVERIGTDDDATIVNRLVERGYYVIVMNYRGNENAVSPYLDWSVQSIKQRIISGEIPSPHFSGNGKQLVGYYEQGYLSNNFVLPAGYDIAYEVPYFAYDLHGAAGTLERIVEIWNNDFKSVKRACLVKWVDGEGLPKIDGTDPLTEAQTSSQDTRKINYATWFTSYEAKNGITTEELKALRDAGDESWKSYVYTYVGNTVARDIYDCVKPNGDFIDLNLYMDIIYPTGTDLASDSVPVMVAMGSNYHRAAAMTSADRPQLQGFLFQGYIGVVQAYGLVPMCRDDHYGYFCGDSQMNSVSGDNATYSLSSYNSIKSDTAMLRMLRAMSDTSVSYTNAFGSYTLSLPFLKQDGIGVFGNSKGGSGSRLGTTSPETLEELRHLPGHVGETRYDHVVSGDVYGALGYTDPYLNDGNALVRAPEEQPYLGYSSKANLTYAECGAAQATIEVENSLGAQSPIFCTGTQIPGDSSYWVFYRGVMNQARNANAPFYGLLSPNCGHTFGSGLDKYYGIDTYYAFHRYANYWLKGESPSCEIIDVDNPGYIGSDAEGYDASANAPTLTIDRVYEIGAGASIKIQFIGAISGDEIAKVTVTNALTGESLHGQWTSSFGEQQWEFVPTDIEEGCYYTVTVPSTVTARNGKPLVETKTLTFRTNTAVSDGASVVDTSFTDGADTATFVFEKKAYTETHSVLLRFAVENEATNVLSIYPVTGYGTASEALGEKLGEVAVYGMGAYTFDVTEYAKAHSTEEQLVFRAVAKPAEQKLSSFTDLSEMTNGVTHLLSGRGEKGQIMNSNHSLIVTDADKFADSEHGTVLRFDTVLPTANYVNLKGELEGNEVGNHSDILTIYSGIFGAQYTGTYTAEMLQSLYGRTFTFSFDVYDTTSRQIHVGIQRVESGKVVDFRAPDTTVRTTKDGWKTVSITLTYDEWISCTVLDKCRFFLSFENKTQTLTSSFVPRLPDGRANGDANTASRFATENGFDIENYTYIDFVGNGGIQYRTDEDGNLIAYGTSPNTKAGYAANKDYSITMNGECYYPVYFDNFKVTESVTRVSFASTAALVSTAASYDSLPVLNAATVTDGETDTDGELLIGGGSYGVDRESKKVYVGLDLSSYAGKTASVAFKASGVGTSFSVYGLKSAAAWTKDTVTAENAPANDPSSSGVDLDKVYGGAPLATYTLTAETETYRLDITDYTKEMKAQGAEMLTLIFISATNGAEKTTITFSENDKPFMGIKGDNSSGTNEISTERENVYQTITDFANDTNSVVRLYLASEYMTRANAGFQLGLGSSIGTWTEADVGKTYRVTFKLRSSQAGTVSLGMRKWMYCFWEWEKDANGNPILGEDNKPHTPSTKAEDHDPANWERGDYPKSTQTVTVSEANKWQTVTYEFTVYEDMLPTEFRPGNGTYYAVNSLALSTYTGMNVAGYTGAVEDLWLDVDDLTVQELSGTTKLEILDAPKDTVKGSFDFSGTNKPTMGIKGTSFQYSETSTSSEIHEEREGIYQTLTETVGGQSNSFVRLNASSDVMKSASAGFQLCLGDAIGTWTAADVGKTYRVTFKLRSSQTGSVSLGMRKNMYCFWGTDAEQSKEEGKCDPYNWERKDHAGTTQQVTVATANEWQSVTYEFTVSADMLPTQFRPTASTTFYQCDRLAIATYNGMNIKNATEAVNIDIDDLTVTEVNDGAKYTGYEKSLTFADGSGRGEFTNYTAYGADNAELLYVQDGKIYFNPLKNHNNRANENSNVHFLNSLSDVLKSENVGNTYHISFRVKADISGFLDFGFTTNATAFKKEETNQAGEGYRFAFYEGVSYKAVIDETDTWLRFGFDFTVEEGMLSENLSNTSAKFGLAFKCYNGYADASLSPINYKDVHFVFDDISVRAVEPLKSSSSLSVTDAISVLGAGNESSLTLEKGGDLPLEGVKKTYLTFRPNATEEIYSALLNLWVTESDGQKLLVCLNGASTPFTSFTATVGKHVIDLTEIVKASPTEAFTLCLVTEQIGAKVDVKLENSGTQTPTLVVESESTEDFDASAFKVKTNLTLAADLCCNIYVPVSRFVSTILLAGEEADLATLPTEVKDGTLYYRLTKALAPKDAADSFTLSVTVMTAEGEKTADYVLSVPAYADKIVNGESYSDATKTLMRDMLAYVDAAMTYFGTATTEKQEAITDVIGTDYALPSDSDVDLTANDVVFDKNGDAVETVSLLLENAPAFAFKLAEGKESLADSFNFTMNGTPLKVEKRMENGRTYLVVTTYAYGMNDTLTFTYAGGSGSYNLAKYHQGTGESDTALRTLTVRLAKYAKSADAYRAEQA